MDATNAAAPTEERPADQCEEGGAAQDDATVEYAPSHFIESEAVLEALARLQKSLPQAFDEIVKDPATLKDVGFIETTLCKYQEFPQLVKHFLEALIEPLTSVIVSRLPALEVAALSGGATTVASETSGTEAVALARVEAKLGQNFDLYDCDAERSSLHTAARLIYIIAKVAGHKSVTAFFPHDVRLVERVFYSLREWQSTRHREWEVRYALLLWLSNLVLVPFALTTVDSTSDGSLGQRMLECSIGFLSDASKCNDAAALLIARLMTRPDSALRRLAFFRYCAGELETMKSEASHVKHGGLLRAIATTFKIGRRDELVAHATGLIPIVGEQALSSPDALVCKTAVKVMQRLGLACLQRRAQNWQYRKAQVDLEANLTGAAAVQHSIEAAAADKEAADEADVDVPEEIETVIDVLLKALSHADTIVRYSAAKGIGRICERLPKDFADEVVSSVLEKFKLFESDSGWHGACLSLAELCRRNVLLPSRFVTVVPIVKRALVYDLIKGSYSVGSNVRDAACYVCWSVARAYSVADLREHVDHLSSTLVIAALFDREVNVRRAAAAAFQECVGRLGSFPDGIALIQLMDFFSLSTLSNSFTQVAPLVAAYDAYRPSMVEHLTTVKLYHWDREMRRLSALALGAISPLCSAAEQQAIVAKLAVDSSSALAAQRHGSVLCLAQLIAALPVDTWGDCRALAQIIPNIESKRLFRGRGGEFVRQACCQFLRALASRELGLPTHVTIKSVVGDKSVTTHSKHQEFFEDTWKQPLEWLQADAAEAFDAYAARYYTRFDVGTHRKMINKMLDGLALTCPPNERRGNALALGALPVALLEARHEEDRPLAASGGASSAGPRLVLDVALAALLQATLPFPDKPAEEQDPECRRNAITSAVQIILRLPVPSEEALDPLLNARRLGLVCGALLQGFDDYAIDKRGDVGMFVRVACIKSTVALLTHIVTRAPRLGAQSRALDLVKAIVKQAVEKIDKVRQIAGDSLVQFASDSALAAGLAAACADSTTTDVRALSDTLTPSVTPVTAAGEEGLPQRRLQPSAADALPDVKALLASVATAAAANSVVDWGSPVETFPVLVDSLHLPTFRAAVLEGLLLAVGGKVVHVMKPALAALGATLHEREELKSAVTADLVFIARAYQGVSRLTECIYCTMDRLLDQRLLDTAYIPALTTALIGEFKTFSKDIKVLLPLVPPLASLCRGPASPARAAAWQHMLSMIASRFPTVRRACGIEFYTALTALQGTTDAGDIDLEAAATKLASTQWDDTNATTVRSARDELFPLLHLEKPVPKEGVAADGVLTQRKPKAQDFSSYRRLVDEMGF